MNPNERLLAPRTDGAKSADYFDADAWISVLEEYPRTSRRVFVRMGSGSVEMASWDGPARTWTYSPFPSEGTPVAWAGLPLSH